MRGLRGLVGTSIVRCMIQTMPHAAHWGAFTAVVENDRLIGVRPFADDPDPSVLISGMPDLVHSPLRIDRPYVRKGWLDGDRAGGTFRGDSHARRVSRSSREWSAISAGAARTPASSMPSSRLRARRPPPGATNARAAASAQRAAF